MTDSQQPQITRSSPKTDGRFRSAKQHYAWKGSTLPDLLNKQFGHVTVISSKIVRKNGYIYLKCKCNDCGKVSLIYKDSLLRGVSKGCQSCTNTISKSSGKLGRRYDDILQRCRNPKHPNYPSYGGRGIELRFGSRREFILWIEENLPHDSYNGLEIDRINNDGHYEPGNLRLATRKEQVANRRNTGRVMFQGQLVLLDDFKSPYNRSTTMKKSKQGMTGEDMIAEALETVKRKGTKWRMTETKLKSLGYMT